MSDVFEIRGDLRQWISRCMDKDKFRLNRSIKKLKSLQGDDKATALNKLQTAIVESVQIRHLRHTNVPEIEYEHTVTEQKSVIADAIEQHQVVIIAGETGFR